MSGAWSWPVRWPQVREVMRLELTRSVSGWRSLWLVWFAFAPVLIIGAHALQDHDHRLEHETLILAGIVQIFYVRFGIFFGALGLFLRLFRGEVAERTLHYAFLAPVRREALVVGKFLAGVFTAVGVFGVGVATSFVLMYAHFPAGREFLIEGRGASHLGAYLTVTVLACIGYGAVFVALSLLVKNPIVPSVSLLVWEGINGALPVWLKHLSVTFYLKPLFPVELPIAGISGLFTVVAEPVAPAVAIAGLLLFAALVVAAACWRIRGMEVSYSAD
ncbi:MAG TPA: hypothetical protein VMR21_04925 [Vicinamibacteria bacterium]|nr:hypothetical protein [Vicinamibacteria bacterium]